MRGLNYRIDKAAKLWKTHRIEAETIVGGIEENPLFEFESIDELGKIRDSERDKLYNQYPSIRDVMNYLSERAAHPLRIDGSYLEGEETGGQQYDQLWLSLALLYGLLKEYEITFEETDLEDKVSRYVVEIEEMIKEAMPGVAPAFIGRYD